MTLTSNFLYAQLLYSLPTSKSHTISTVLLCTIANTDIVSFFLWLASFCMGNITSSFSISFSPFILGMLGSNPKQHA